MINGYTTCGVIVPVYRGLKWLPALLKSLFDQSIELYRIEPIFIINESETSDTEYNLCYQHSKTLLKTLDKVEINWNLGLTLLNSDYFVILGQDDFLTTDSILNGVAYLDTHPDIDCVYGHHHIVDSDHKRIALTHAPRFTSYLLEKGNFLFSSAWMARRSVVDHIGYFRTDTSVISDYEFWVRAYLNGHTIKRGNYVAGNLCNRPDSAYYNLRHLEEKELEWLKSNKDWNSVRFSETPVILRKNF